MVENVSIVVHDITVKVLLKEKGQNDESGFDWTEAADWLQVV